MCVCFWFHRMNEGDFINMFRHMRHHTWNYFATLSRLLESPGRLHQVSILPLKADQIFLAGQWLIVIFFQWWFVIPQINMRCCTGTEDLQYAFYFSRLMRFPFARMPLLLFTECVITDQLRQSNPRQRRRNVSPNWRRGSAFNNWSVLLCWEVVFITVYLSDNIITRRVSEGLAGSKCDGY